MTMKFLGAPMCFAALVWASVSSAQGVAEFDPHLAVTADAAAPSLALRWQGMKNAAGFSVARRPDGKGPWAPVATLPANAASWTDSAIEVGKSYEYRVVRSGNDGTAGVGYVLAGVNVPLPDDAGVIAVVVSLGSVATYAERLPRLEQDLRAEGWEVVREEVGERESPPDVRARLQKLQAASVGRLRAALLLGQVPQPYSGFQNPDGHPEHRGAWPADTYYSDLDGTWTDQRDLGGPDTGVLEPPKGRPEKMINIAGDGKLDQDEIPSDLDIAVGRIDARDMPGYAPLDAADLENRYLDNDHAFRTGAVTFARRTSVTDLLHVFNGDPLARMAYRDGSAVFGEEPDEVGSGSSFFSALESPGGYGLSFAISYGHTDGNDAIGLNQPFKNHKARAFLLGAFGSFFGDWSTTNNLLRDAIFHPGMILASNWCNWPDNHYHQLGALWTIGATLLVSFNDDYRDQMRGARGKHSGLMGDPSLRLFVTQPPAMLEATRAPAGGVALSWQASPAAGVVGYHVYRGAPDGRGVEERVTPSPVAQNTFVDSTAQSGAGYRYRVVAVELVNTGSGSFYNNSPGAIVATEPTPLAGGAGGSPAATGGSMTVASGGMDSSSASASAQPDAVGGSRNAARASTAGDPASESCACTAPGGHPRLGFAALALAGIGLLATRRRRSTTS